MDVAEHVKAILGMESLYSGEYVDSTVDVNLTNEDEPVINAESNQTFGNDCDSSLSTE